MKTKNLLILTAMFGSCWITSAAEPKYRVQSNYRDPFDVKSAIENAEKLGLGMKLQTEIRSQVKFSGSFKVGDQVKAVINGKMYKKGDKLKVSAFGDKVELELVELDLKPAKAVFRHGELIVVFEKNKK